MVNVYFQIRSIMIISLLLFTAIQEVAMKTPAVMFKPIGTLGLDANFNLPVRYARFQAIEATTGEKYAFWVEVSPRNHWLKIVKILKIKCLRD